MEGKSEALIVHQVRDAIVSNLTRQAELPDSGLECIVSDARLTVWGEIDVDALAHAIVAATVVAP